MANVRRSSENKRVKYNAPFLVCPKNTFCCANMSTITGKHGVSLCSLLKFMPIMVRRKYYESELDPRKYGALFQLAGKTAIVTGAGNGIGRGIAQKLAGLGANVVACDIEAESVRNTADEITLAGGVCLGLYCDVRKYEDIQKVVDTAVQKFGTVDILVNDAAGCGGGVTVDTINEQEWMRLIELNLNSVFRFTMTVLPIMRAKNRGKS